MADNTIPLEHAVNGYRKHRGDAHRYATDTAGLTYATLAVADASIILAHQVGTLRDVLATALENLTTDSAEITAQLPRIISSLAGKEE